MKSASQDRLRQRHLDLTVQLLDLSRLAHQHRVRAAELLSAAKHCESHEEKLKIELRSIMEKLK